MGNYPLCAQRHERYHILVSALREFLLETSLRTEVQPSNEGTLLKVIPRGECDWFDYVTPMHWQATPVNNDVV